LRGFSFLLLNASSRSTGNLLKKLRLVYLPFLIISVAFIGGYTSLHWLVLIKAGLLSLREDLVNFFLPYGLALVVVVVWLRPRLALLRFKKESRFKELCYFVAAGAMVAPTVIAQLWMSSAAGGVTQLDTISDISAHPKTKYYMVQAVAIDKQHSSRYTITSYEGRNSETLQIACYFACPLGTRRGAEPVWLGAVYKSRISSRQPESVRTNAIRTFIIQAYDQYLREELDRFTYLSRPGWDDDYRGYEAAIAENPLHRRDSPFTLLIRHTDDYASRSGNLLGWVYGSFAIGAGLWLLMILPVSVDAKAMGLFEQGSGPRIPKAFQFEKALLLPKRGFFVTPLIIDLNLLVFVVMVFAGLGVVSVTAQELLAIGAIYRPAILEGQVWRLLSSMFIHAGLMHVAGNLVSLLLAGLFLERAMGSVWFVSCYLVCGVTGGIASAVYHPATVAVGASGAIFGLWGVLLLLGLTKSKHTSVQFKHVLTVAAVTIGYNLVLGFASIGIDNAAHVGGLVAGLVFGAAARMFPDVLLRGAAPARPRSRSTNDVAGS
jgi:membrane associated rhomboid family serine protease